MKTSLSSHYKHTYIVRFYINTIQYLKYYQNLSKFGFNFDYNLLTFEFTLGQFTNDVASGDDS